MSKEKEKNMLLAEAYAKLGNIKKTQECLASCTDKHKVDSLMELVTQKALGSILDEMLSDLGLNHSQEIPDYGAELKKIYKACSDLGTKDFLFHKIISVFPVDTYILFGEDYFIPSRLGLFREGFIGMLKKTINKFDEEYIDLCNDLLGSKLLSDTKFHCAVADAYISIGYVQKGIDIYDKIQEPYPRKVLKRTAKNRFGEYPHDAADCYFYMKSIEGLNKVLADTLAEESGESTTSEYVIDLIFKLQE